MMDRDTLGVILVVSVIMSGVTLMGFSQMSFDDPTDITLPSVGQIDNDHEPIIFSNIDGDDDASSGIKKFDSYQEIVDYLDVEETDNYDQYYWDRNVMDDMIMFEESASSPNTSIGVSDGASADSGGSYSSTNNQVMGVDEGDRVKNDGEYAYIVSSDRTSIMVLDVNPAEDTRILSTIRSTSYISDIYLTGDKLVIIGQSYYFEEGLYQSNYQYSNRPVISVQVLDTDNKANMTMVKNETLKGNYLTSRMIDSHLYLISNINGYACMQSEDRLPIPADMTYYIEDEEPTRQVTSFMTMDIDDVDSESRVASIMMSSSNNIYVSKNNIFITHPYYQGMYQWRDNGGEYEEKTIIHRLAVSDNDITYAASGEVVGTPLNRYSMDEFDGHFRIATSTGWMNENQVIVLDEELNKVGSVDNIAPGERIYSARFMGEKLYLVTFRQVDPFYVIDLADPANPEILGELKIPGYSDYLHPYDENHIIGLGKEGRKVKISLFDVTNVSDPIELDKMIIEGSYSDSEALHDPHAFLFSKEKNMLVIPMYVNDYKYSYDDVYGTIHTTWAGSYVFDISPEDGINLEAKIPHELDDDSVQDNDYYYMYSSFEQAGRAFYIDDVLYTVSHRVFKATSLDDFDDIQTVYLTP